MYYIENGMEMGSEAAGEMTFNKNKTPRGINKKKKIPKKIKEL